MFFRKLMVGVWLCLISNQIVAMKRAGAFDLYNPQEPKKHKQEPYNIYADLEDKRFGAVLSAIDSGKVDFNKPNRMGELPLGSALNAIGNLKLAQLRNGVSMKADIEQGYTVVSKIIDAPSFDGNIIHQGRERTALLSYVQCRNSPAAILDRSADRDEKEMVIFSKLLSKSRGVMDIGDLYHGRTPLHHLMQPSGLSPIDDGEIKPADVQKLKYADALLAFGANPDSKDNKGKTALHDCTTVEDIFLLSSHGASPHVTTYPTDNHPQGQTAHDLAKNRTIRELLKPELFDECGDMIRGEVLREVVLRNQKSSFVNYAHDRSISGSGVYNIHGIRSKEIIRIFKTKALKIQLENEGLLSEDEEPLLEAGGPL